MTQPNPFQKAKKRNIKLRLALTGTAGSGKTYTALEIAKHFSGKTALIDTEHGSSEAYGDVFDFDVLKLTSFSPEHYVAAIHAAEVVGYDNIIIDSLSHAWTGKDGALQLVDDFTASSGNKNKFTSGWSVVTPMQNEMIEAILASPANMFVTMRTKTEYVLEEVNGKKVPVKKGMAPVQRDGVDYEFSLVLDLDTNNNGTISKSRALIPELKKDKFFHHPGEQFAKLLLEWMNSGAPVEPKIPEPELLNLSTKVSQGFDANGEFTAPEESLEEFTARKVDEQKKEREARERTAAIIKEIPKSMQPKEEVAVEELSYADRVQRAEDFLMKNKVKGYMTKKQIFERRMEKIKMTILSDVSDVTLKVYLSQLAGLCSEVEESKTKK